MSIYISSFCFFCHFCPILFTQRITFAWANRNKKSQCILKYHFATSIEFETWYLDSSCALGVLIFKGRRKQKVGCLCLGGISCNWQRLGCTRRIPFSFWGCFSFFLPSLVTLLIEKECDVFWVFFLSAYLWNVYLSYTVKYNSLKKNKSRED